MIERIKFLRKELDLSQADFAKRIKITQGHLSDIENGRKILTERTIKIICSEFNVSEAWLKTGEGEPFYSSPYEKEFFELFESLTPETQEYLLDIAKGLLKTQEKLLNKK